MAEAAVRAGLPIAREAFADRAYDRDGALIPRSQAGSILTDPRRVAARAVRIVTEGRVESIDGIDIEVPCDTLCIHGDTPGAAALARAVRDALGDAGVVVRKLVNQRILASAEDGGAPS